MNIDITSSANPKIKWVKSLHSNSNRKKENVFVVEGAKEIAYAIDGGFLPHSFFVCPEIYGEKIPKLNIENIFTVNKSVFEKISYRKNSDGLIAVFEAKNRSLDDLTFGENPFFIVIESIEKPGNLGAIIRTADGSGADAVIICEEKADIFNPNVIRASVGTIFSKQVVSASSVDVYDFLEKHEINTYGAILSDKSKVYTNIDFNNPTALILGAEHSGLSKFWQNKSVPIVIPMKGLNDSLNVSSAAAILAYEVVRQRNAN